MSLRVCIHCIWQINVLASLAVVLATDAVYVHSHKLCIYNDVNKMQRETLPQNFFNRIYRVRQLLLSLWKLSFVQWIKYLYYCIVICLYRVLASCSVRWFNANLWKTSCCRRASSFQIRFANFAVTFQYCSVWMCFRVVSVVKLNGIKNFFCYSKWNENDGHDTKKYNNHFLHL